MLRNLTSLATARRLALQECLGTQQSALQRVGMERVVSTSACAHVAEQQGAAAEPAAAPPAGPAAAAAQPVAKPPRITAVLGFSGVLPFYAFLPVVAPHLPLDIVLEPAMLANPGLLQVAYGATILSFLGGVHWGVAMTNIGGAAGAKLAGERYLWSVLPCLMAWPTVAMPVTQAAGIQAALLGVVYVVDRAWAGRGLLPPWYLKLRTPLTLLAAGGLALTASSGGL